MLCAYDCYVNDMRTICASSTEQSFHASDTPDTQPSQNSYEVTVAQWRSRVAARSSPPSPPVYDSPPSLMSDFTAPRSITRPIVFLSYQGSRFLLVDLTRYSADYSSSDHFTSDDSSLDSPSDSSSATSLDSHSDTSSDSPSRHSLSGERRWRKGPREIGSEELQEEKVGVRKSEELYMITWWDIPIHSALLDVIPSTLDVSYAVEIADGRISETNVILRGCTLGLLGHPFNINLMPVELGIFDVIVGMDWLAKYHAMIICDERIVCIPYGDEVLIIKGDGCNGGITAKKTDDKSEEKLLEDVPIVRDFPEVFPEDLPGLPPTQQVEFQIDLVHDAAPVSGSPYRLTPSEIEETCNLMI
ncbi:putative reverse transcriptase domain-containing protein [Tanacetum coccineum]|uniref:Reverse transcriptase domain-containing protein n=1 Tax=Tanacetum coccineum TaxID=301880 RepID=A0ABQ5IEI9_9ASTR